ncbi:DUF4179 domain-containing protein [Peribacillus sp. SCS-155]|uniref:DUF4179 domain-containing protein n=1 Tax=Peribacillus sedimenti TaxID=3115297 RepID=UPI0039058A2B
MVSNKENMDKHTNLDQLQVPVSLENFTKKLPQRYQNGEFDDSRINQVDREWEQHEKRTRKQWSTVKKSAATVLAASACFLLLIGSGFVSPTMAKMVSKIPPLSTIYDRFDTPVQQIEKNLKKEGFPIKQVVEHVGGSKEGVYIFLDASKEQVEEMKEGVEKTAFNIINSNQYEGTVYEDYYVKVKQHKEPSQEWKEKDARYQKEWDEIAQIVEPILTFHDYKQSWGGGQNTVHLEFPNTESPEKIAEIEKNITDALKAAGKDNVKIERRIFNLAKEQQYQRWGNAISGIGSELKMYKKYKVSSVGYKSLKGKMMQIHIGIKLPSTDPKAAVLAADLRTMIEEFIHTDEIWNQVKQDDGHYEIIIKGKDKKVITE